MKALILGALLSMGLQAQATGCLGGDWVKVSEENLGPTELSTNSYGEPWSEVKVTGQSAYITLKHIGNPPNKLTFYSGTFSLTKIDLVAVLRKIGELKPTVVVATKKTVEVNNYYDDCSDIPENTQMATLRYTFLVDGGKGEMVSFDADHVTYDPPLP